MLVAPNVPVTVIENPIRPFSWATIAFGVFPLFLLLAITAFGGPEGYFLVAIIAFGGFGFIVPKYYCHLEKRDKRSLDSLIQGGYGLQGCAQC